MPRKSAETYFQKAENLLINLLAPKIEEALATTTDPVTGDWYWDRWPTLYRQLLPKTQRQVLATEQSQGPHDPIRLEHLPRLFAHHKAYFHRRRVLSKTETKALAEELPPIADARKALDDAQEHPPAPEKLRAAFHALSKLAERWQHPELARLCRQALAESP